MWRAGTMGWALLATAWLLPAATMAQSADGPPCVPRCRSGFVCYQGKCISACNPPCEEGMRCGTGGECVPVDSEDDGRMDGGKPPPPPLPPPEQEGYGATKRGGDKPPPPPPGGSSAEPGGSSYRGRGSPPAEESVWSQAEPAEDRSEDPGRGFRVALSGPLLGLGGEADTGMMGTVNMSPSYGFGGLLEGNLPFFGLGGGFRVTFWTFDGIGRYRGLDFFFSPRLRIPFGDAAGEVYVASPIGFNVDVTTGDGASRTAGGGWNFAVRTGVQVYLADHFGVFFGLGGLFRGVVFAGSAFLNSVRTRQLMLEFGIAYLE